MRLNRAVSFDTLIVTNVSANFTRSRRIGASKPQLSTAFTHCALLGTDEPTWARTRPDTTDGRLEAPGTLVQVASGSWGR